MTTGFFVNRIEYYVHNYNLKVLLLCENIPPCRVVGLLINWSSGMLWVIITPICLSWWFLVLSIWFIIWNPRPTWVKLYIFIRNSDIIILLEMQMSVVNNLKLCEHHHQMERQNHFLPLLQSGTECLQEKMQTATSHSSQRWERTTVNIASVYCLFFNI